MQREELTQLEFIDGCARELACDGVVLDVRHFPRLDDDYLAQIKKLTTDLGLCIAALADDGFFTSDDAAMAATLERAQQLGAPLVTSRLAIDTERSWTDQLGRLNVATGLAKAQNITLAVRNAPGTFAATAHDAKRVSKESDSAWLRFGLEPAALAPGDDFTTLIPRTVLLWAMLNANRESLTPFEDFRGHLTLDDPSGEATFEVMKNAIRETRTALLRLNHT
jgi:hypothetical protein